jgi:hypothetical protein
MNNKKLSSVFHFAMTLGVIRPSQKALRKRGRRGHNTNARIAGDDYAGIENPLSADAPKGLFDDPMLHSALDRLITGFPDNTDRCRK